ncbi:universal stress protein [Tautonia sp. JC769]|uniref:universal stress protein n=1 Tax=Tautonia sp. JC769 TaxID=3232135 RepID=UPI00345A441C
MLAIQKILVPLDHEAEPPNAVDRAIRLADHFHASITLLGLVQELPWYARIALHDADRVDQAVLDDARRRVEAAADRVSAAGVGVETRVARGRPAVESVREAVRGGHDLLVKDAAASDEGAFHSADRQILRTCPCPVWLSRSGGPRDPGARERMLALVDPAPMGGAPESSADRESVGTRVLDLAVALADADAAELIVAHVWDAEAQGILRNCGYSDEQIQTYVNNVRSGAARALDRLVARHRGRIGSEAVQLLRGAPNAVIPEFVEAQRIDVIIMGTMARSGVAGMLIGNTAESLLGQASCSILAVKPGGFVSPIHADAPDDPGRPG